MHSNFGHTWNFCRKIKIVEIWYQACIKKTLEVSISSNANYYEWDGFFGWLEEFIPLSLISHEKSLPRFDSKITTRKSYKLFEMILLRSLSFSLEKVVTWRFFQMDNFTVGYFLWFDHQSSASRNPVPLKVLFPFHIFVQSQSNWMSKVWNMHNTVPSS